MGIAHMRHDARRKTENHELTDENLLLLSSVCSARLSLPMTRDARYVSLQYSTQRFAFCNFRKSVVS